MSMSERIARFDELKDRRRRGRGVVGKYFDKLFQKIIGLIWGMIQPFEMQTVLTRIRVSPNIITLRVR